MEKDLKEVEVLVNFTDKIEKVDRVAGDKFKCETDRAIYLSDCVIDGHRYNLVKILEDEVVISSEDILDPSKVKPEDTIEVEADKVTIEKDKEEAEAETQEEVKKEEDVSQENIEDNTEETKKEAEAKAKKNKKTETTK